MSDPVQAPSHYVAGEYECIDVMRAVFTADEFRAYCLCTAFAYLWRHGRKDGEPIERDVAKAARYLRWAREVEVPERGEVTTQDNAEQSLTRDEVIEEMKNWRQMAHDHEEARQDANAEIVRLEEDNGRIVGELNMATILTRRAEQQRDAAIKERDKWYQAYSNHSASIVRLMAKIDDLTAKDSPT